MTSWVQRLREGEGERGGAGGFDAPQPRPTVPPVQSQKRRFSLGTPPKDVNVPKKRFQIHQKCLYERMLPGQAFVSAHVNRLQHGFYESNSLHEDNVDNVYFISVHFVFHPHDPRSHRIKSAEIQVCVHGDHESATSAHVHSHPRILKHAPELMFGAVSPENLQWNFSLSSSLGVSQAPVSATLNPTGGVKGSYKLFHMMSIQGSIRSVRNPLGPEYDVEDGMAVWTLEENILQRSGLPREFDFVLLVHKPDDVKNVYLTVDVDAEVEAWFGTYPKWYTNLPRYLPSQDYTLGFDTDIGQRFLPSQPGRGFNFASLPHALEEYVAMPGTVYPTNDTKGEDEQFRSPEKFDHAHMEDNKDFEVSPAKTRAPQSPTPARVTQAASMHRGSEPDRHSWAPENVNVRVVLEHQYPPQSPDSRRISYSPLSNYEAVRHPSIRRRKSRTGLKEYGAKQALQELAHTTLEEKGNGDGRMARLSGH